MSEPTTITYADLRDDDILIDKSGGRWHVSGVEKSRIIFTDDGISFWLGDARTKVRAHHMTKPAGDPCTVDRVETLADTVKALEDGWIEDADGRRPMPGVTHEQAVEVMAEMMGATVDTDSTAAEVDAAAKSTDDDPAVLPLFETMTPLEQRSHLFVLHGVFADDLDDAKTLCDLHFNVTRDRAQLKLRSVYKPHEHSASVK